MEQDQHIHLENLRQETYQLLASCYAIPDEELPERKMSLMSVVGQVFSDLSSSTSIEVYDTSLETLRIDHSKLFIGPFKLLAPPYGSVYLDGQRQVMGASTIEVQNRYQEAGLELAKNFREAPDHIAAELEFMYFLIYREIEALESSDLQTALHYLKFQGAFLQDHLGAWIAAFAFNVEENAETEFYKNLAKITKLFVQKDMAKLLSTTIPEFGALTETE
jgi:TorA maturation chaperone TorD